MKPFIAIFSSGLMLAWLVIFLDRYPDRYIVVTNGSKFCVAHERGKLNDYTVYDDKKFDTYAQAQAELDRMNEVQRVAEQAKHWLKAVPEKAARTGGAITNVGVLTNIVIYYYKQPQAKDDGKGKAAP